MYLSRKAAWFQTSNSPPKSTVCSVIQIGLVLCSLTADPLVGETIDQSSSQLPRIHEKQTKKWLLFCSHLQWLFMAETVEFQKSRGDLWVTCWEFNRKSKVKQITATRLMFASHFTFVPDNITTLEQSSDCDIVIIHQHIAGACKAMGTSALKSAVVSFNMQQAVECCNVFRK